MDKAPCMQLSAGPKTSYIQPLKRGAKLKPSAAHRFQVINTPVEKMWPTQLPTHPGFLDDSPYTTLHSLFALRSSFGEDRGGGSYHRKQKHLKSACILTP